MPRFDGRFFPSSTVTDWAGGKFGTPGWYPNEPTGVTVTEGDQQATLEWTAGRSNGLDITGYKIEKNDGSWATAVANTASAAGSKVVTGLTNGTSYTFRIKAINSLGESEAYSVVSAAKVPRGAPLIPGTLSASTFSASSINLSWSAGGTNGATITGYSIQKSTDGSTWSSITSNTGNTNTTYAATGLAASTQYYFKVAAVNVAGIGAYSNEPNATTNAAFNATGGTITTSGGYKIHTFTSTGTFAVTTGGADVEVLMVSGGGSGAGYSHPWSPQNVAGGGGGGGCVNEYTKAGTDETLTFADSTNYAVTIGSGYTNSNGGGGYPGYATTLIGGSIDYRTGRSGGARGDSGQLQSEEADGGTAPHEDTGGGGGNGCYTFYTPYGAIHAYYNNWQGGTGSNSNNEGGPGGDDGGGNGGKWSRYNDTTGYAVCAGGGGGGGPSGANGSNGYALAGSGAVSGNYGGAGGNGTASSFSGSSVTYGGGGGGNGHTTNNNNAAGGSGGGGQGGTSMSGAGGGAAAANGSANTGGGGGGGGGGSSPTAKSGGSGILIIRYAA